MDALEAHADRLRRVRVHRMDAFGERASIRGAGAARTSAPAR
ncbi:hypothetical protein SAMN05216276_101750 [Streptosporangium subroseum]|uniref:Uncharacterized protein n=1 Tax=Streptosporangium subroseum TaxID=106412 RepID=A0A239HN15_9ACTN|nr:hypothetical protein [Streptosporangium subroseum]SNS82737.1 hypothetical protein SAMN05216276_101750 [Streptosporangium subroseum]